jgi:DNA polymerase-1
LESVYRLAGGEFNLNSPKQLSQILFEKLRLRPVKKIKTGYSTNEEVLVHLAKNHPLPELILEYRQLAKLKSTYIDALPKLVDPQTGHIHARFNQAGAETGRLSSHNPNLQNIPIRTELGRQIRRAFVAFGPGQALLSADYSQIELRILAHLCQDANLLKAFAEGEDIHNYTAALIFDVAESQVDAAMRNTAKRVNFGIIYGMGAFGLSKDLGISQAEAQEFIDKYFLRYPKVRTFMDAAIQEAQDHGYVLTLLNRRRYLPEIKSANMAARQFAQRQAINTPVQGSAADMMKLAMIHIEREMRKRRLTSKMIITVHDELVFNVPIAERGLMMALVRDCMEHALELRVPIKVSMKTGPNWLDMKPVEDKA